MLELPNSNSIYGTLIKSLCRVNKSLVLRNFLNVTVSSCSRAHLDQVRKSPSKKFHIVDTKNYEIFQEKCNDGVLFLQIYCPSTVTCTPLQMHLWDFFENFNNSFF